MCIIYGILQYTVWDSEIAHGCDLWDIAIHWDSEIEHEHDLGSAAVLFLSVTVTQVVARTFNAVPVDAGCLVHFPHTVTYDMQVSC